MKKKATKTTKMKRGRAFEECVAAVVQVIDPQAVVRQGTWIDGPDGRRDRDVSIEGTVDGVSYSALIECKDYDRKTTGPVGIAVVDAFDSKRRDCGSDIAIICSNAGFTDPAIRKAKRVGIVLIGVFRQDDGRIQHQLFDSVYFRRLKIDHMGFRLEHVYEGNTRHCADISIMFQGQPVANWLCHWLRSLIMSNPIGGGSYTGLFEFKRPTAFDVADGSVFVATQMFSELILSGGWFEQSAIIDGTAGVYDFVRRRVRVGAGPYQVQLKGMDVTKGTAIDYPPDAEIDISSDIAHDEAWFQILYLEDANCHEPIPPLDDLIVERDLDPIVLGLPPQLQRANSGGVQKKFYVSVNPKVGPDHTFTLTSPGQKESG
ncbi:MAG: restriction endonuclease [Pseudomonadota bacterium]